MKSSTRILCALTLLLPMAGGAAFAATPKVEGTPAPMVAKPDFSTMKFLIGTWNCVDLSSRRPGPFNTTEVYSMIRAATGSFGRRRFTSSRGFRESFKPKRSTRGTPLQSVGCVSTPAIGEITWWRPPRCRPEPRRLTLMSLRANLPTSHRTSLKSTPK